MSSYHCVQEEERLKRDKTESAHLAMTSKDKRNKRRKLRKLWFQNHKSNRKRMKIRMAVTFLDLKVMYRSLEPIITHGVQRKV